VLLDQNALGQRVDGIYLPHIYRSLDHNRSVVQVSSDEMNRAATDLDAVLEGRRQVVVRGVRS
jgi:hypothetical protein